MYSDSTRGLWGIFVSITCYRCYYSICTLWVYTGDRASKGIFLGVKRSGVVVVAWYGNAKSRVDYRDYLRSLRDYALGV